MPSGGGGSVEVDTQPQQVAVDFLKEVFYDWAVPLNQPTIDLFAPANQALAYAFGIGGEPQIFADPIYAPGTGPNASASAGVTAVENDALRGVLERELSALQASHGQMTSDNSMDKVRHYQIDNSARIAELEAQLEGVASSANVNANTSNPGVLLNDPSENLFTGYQEAPGLEYIRQQGYQAIKDNYGPIYGHDAGPVSQALMDYNREISTNDYFNRYISGLFALSGTQQNSINSLLGIGSNSAQGVSQSANSQVAAQTQAAIANQQSRGNMFSSFGNVLGSAAGMALAFA